MVKYVSYPPPKYSDNPFLTLYCKWLGFYGWELCEFNFNVVNLIKHAGKVQVCYFHWPQTIWRYNNFFKALIKGSYFIINCLVAKLLGYKLIWSAHNVLPHEYQKYRFERYMRMFIIKTFDIIVGHSLNTYGELQNLTAINFSAKFTLVEHGHYEDIYKADYQITRETLKIPASQKIILLKCSKKNYQGSCDALQFLLNNPVHKSLHFILIGDIYKSLKPLLLEKNNITVVNGEIDNTSLANYISLCDLVWMPYKKITTSGFYFLALTFKKVVIAPDIEFFRLHSQKGMIYLYRLNDNQDLQNTFYSLSSDQKNEFDYSNLLERFSWRNNTKNLTDKL